MIAHPPYLDIVKFTDDSRDQANISNIDAFVQKALLGPYLRHTDN